MNMLKSGGVTTRFTAFNRCKAPTQALVLE
mgnify:CR=1 FL=1